MKSDDEARKLVENEQIFLMSEGGKYDYYICKGQLGQTYNVVYNKGQDSFVCDCRNIKLTDCKHIKAANLLKEK